MENCGSGALREDNKKLRRFLMQSTSDQELYLNNPSIAMGSEAIIPPEKAGLWVYPYPADSEVKEKFALTEAYVRERKDGKETAFNIVTGLMGAMYLSGRIDLCDRENFALVKKGTEIFKKVRKYIPQSHPIYPAGMHKINDERIAALGLLSRERLMLAVWNTSSEKKEKLIDLSKYVGTLAVKQTYSHNEPDFKVMETEVYTDELISDGKTHLRIDYKVSGIGSASCGPALADQYRLSEKQIDFQFALYPSSKNANI